MADSAAVPAEAVRIRFSHNQIGMTVEAFVGGTWQHVQLIKHGSHKSSAYDWDGRAAVMSTNRDEQAYLAGLDRKGIKYVVEGA